MSKPIKYTSDGRKVRVLGQLNATQHIVQEIFVSDGQEIPSGENFVVSSLHDAPSESWKEKQLRELDERYEKRKKEGERRINEINRTLAIAEAKAKERSAALLAFAKNSGDEQLERLHAFLSGEITHFFVDHYPPEIVDWHSDRLYDTDSWGGRLRVDGIKLVSLLGRSDGCLDYRLNQYRDGSGSSARIVPCRSYDEALAEAQSKLNAEAAFYVSGERCSFSPDRWARIEGIQIPDNARAKWEAEQRKKRLARIEKLRAELTELEAEDS